MLLPALGIIFLISLISCGRRGDPFLSSPVEEIVVEQSVEDVSEPVEEIVVEENVEDVSERAAKQDLTVSGVAQDESEVRTVSIPDAPKGLIAVYTGVTVVITWDEIIGQGVRMYRVYRMDGETYKVVGESVTPAFTDKSIEVNKEYHYRLSAVGLSEGPASEEVIIVTEKK
jgi:hypothetical protein